VDHYTVNRISEGEGLYPGDFTKVLKAKDAATGAAGYLLSAGW
jgi:hypothetical protein